MSASIILQYPTQSTILRSTTPRVVVAAVAGPQGSQGIKGDTGTAATVAVNSTVTGAAGSSALVENLGTTSAASLKFTIPTGTAATIAVGTKTTGAAGSSVNVVNSGTSSAAVFDFTIPKGDTGAAGDWSTAQPNRAWSTRTTLTSADAGYLIFVDSATAISVTSTTALTTGQRIDFLITNATAPSIGAGTGATLAGTPLVGGVPKFRAQYSAATLICTSGASQSYVLVGDLAAA